MIGKTISHYKIIEKLGEGGMGVVYKAEDTKLKRIIALKFLPPSISSDQEAKIRLIQEAQAASAIDHQNICTIYEINETENGQMFIAMAYYEGETLKRKIQLGTINEIQALEIAVQVAQGLYKAHEKGIIHRDFKPANVLVNDDGIVKIVDFGLAKLAGQVKLTKNNTTLGTIAYMSPEQIQAQEADARSDIWSFGIVLYEMLSGKLPFKGEYESALMYSILNEEPEALDNIRSDTALNIEQIINKALKKNKEERYQSFQEVLKDLKPPSEIGLTKERQKKSIIVLPFVNISPDPDQEYFGDGLTEEIITDLSQIQDLLVISRSSAMTFKDTKKKIKEIAKEVNVQHVLEGSVRKAGNNLRITAQLIDAANDTHLWAEKYSGNMENVFDIQEKVSRQIVESLKLRLSPKEDEKLSVHAFENVQAYDLYFRAKREMWFFTKNELSKALNYLQKALDIVGDNIIVYAAMAEACFLFSHFGIEESKIYYKKVEEYANKIFELESDSAYGHCYFGIAQSKKPAGMIDSVKHLKRAYDIDPNNPSTLMWLSLYASETGKPEIAKQCIKRILEIDPFSPNICVTSWAQLMTGEFDIALELASKNLNLFPNMDPFLFNYAHALSYNNQIEKAIEVYNKMIENSPEGLYSKIGALYIQAHKGEQVGTLERITQEVNDIAKWDESFSLMMAEIYALIFENDKAIDWLENTVNYGFINYPFLNQYDPFIENIRKEERFKILMEKVRHEWAILEV